MNLVRRPTANLSIPLEFSNLSTSEIEIKYRERSKIYKKKLGLCWSTFKYKKSI